jgi:amino acid permease
MKTTTFYNNWLTTAGILLALPATFFILIGVLSEFGINGPLEAIQPAAERWGIKDPPAWNITSLVLFRPIVAFLLAISQILKIEWHFTLQKKWFPLLAAVFSTRLPAVLFFYLIGANCNCYWIPGRKNEFSKKTADEKIY